ncbi:Uncharacterized protein Fot_56032 [Forsythia ovata]|uniref:Uncharacterized protein n=1 Tax=Forsythia ovata TaxID=205694 RepID=A0ABD1P1W1_9LAMI
MVYTFLRFELAANSTHIVATAAFPTTPDTNTNNSSARLTAGGTSAAIHKDLFVSRDLYPSCKKSTALTGKMLCFVLDSTATVGDITPSDGIPKHEKEKSTRAQSTATRVNYLVEGHEAHYNSKTMSRRPNSTRRLADSGGIPFMGSLHSKSRSSPLLSVGLLAVGALLIVGYMYHGSENCLNDLGGLQEWNASKLVGGCWGAQRGETESNNLRTETSFHSSGKMKN